MPMVDSGMSTAIKNAIISEQGAAPADPAALQKFCDAVAKGVVLYIQANALVPALGLVAPPGGGPVTGAALVT